MRLGDEVGGHFVFGHVDDTAQLKNIEEDGDSHRLTIQPPAALMKLIVPKGSITLDGVSLTVNVVKKDRFQVNIIPHTWEKTTLSMRKAKDLLNIEVDMLARYVARQMGKAA